MHESALSLVGGRDSHLPLPAEHLKFALLEHRALGQSRIDLGDGHRRVYGTDVDHSLALLAVKVSHPSQRLCTVEFKDKGKVLIQGLLGDALVFLREGDALPILALILAEVQDLEGLAVLDTEQALTGGVDSPAAQVAADPSAAELLGDGECCARATEEVGDKAIGFRRCLYDPPEKPIRFLSWIPKIFS